MKVDFSSTEGEGLFPLQALVEPISLRFKYHFEGSRLTNKLEKVNFYFYTYKKQGTEAY
jgi:hypothetical protein